MIDGKCERCGKPVGKNANVEGVYLTICCERCARAIPNLSKVFGSWYLISKSKAIGTYDLSSKALEILNCVVKKTPLGEYEEGKMSLYVHEEVRLLRRWPEKRRKMERTERQNELMRRKNDLVTKYNVVLEELNPILRIFLFGDFLTSRNPKTKKEDVEIRCSVLDRVLQILKEDPRAHPEAAFQFCSKYPKANANDFLDLKQKMSSVFYIHGIKILHYLPVPELKKLEKSPLKDVYKIFKERDRRALIHGHLMKHVNLETADSILNHPACQTRISRNEDEEKIAEKLFAFWKEKDDIATRKTRLHETMEREGLQISWKRQLEDCDLYVSGLLDCDVDEVVAKIILLRRTIFIRHRVPYKSLLRTFERYRYEHKLSCQDALEKLTNEFDRTVFSLF